MFALVGCATLTQRLPARNLPVRADAWRIEAEHPAAPVRMAAGAIDVDTADGLTLWYARPLQGPVSIEFEAMAMSAGGPNDTVSDLNAFWMATDPAIADGSPLTRPRSGRFEDYDTLFTYYVGIGGNRNTTTRMRRYVGRPGDRPLLPQHDRADPAAMLVANRWIRIRLVADGRHVTVSRDGVPLFTMNDPHPYTRGWFGFRTTASHWRLRHLRVTHP